MNNYYHVLFLLLFFHFNLLKADTSNKESIPVDLLSKSEPCYVTPFPENCTTILNAFAETASSFTNCSLVYARPVRICEKCIEHYLSFHAKYQELLTTVVNGTSCKSIFMSCDRLNAILEYHDNILSIWDKSNCYACYNWTTDTPVLSNETIHFNKLFNVTMLCIKKYIDPSLNDTKVVCDNCMQSYLKLDNYYKTLSADAIGVDSICMDIVDSMNVTRSIWSKSLNCCRIRRTPEVIFLVCTGIISVLPLFYYLVLRYFSPIKDLPNALKQTRFKQTILRSLGRSN